MGAFNQILLDVDLWAISWLGFLEFDQKKKYFERLLEIYKNMTDRLQLWGLKHRFIFIYSWNAEPNGGLYYPLTCITKLSTPATNNQQVTPMKLSNAFDVFEECYKNWNWHKFSECPPLKKDPVLILWLCILLSYDIIKRI